MNWWVANCPTKGMFPTGGHLDKTLSDNCTHQYLMAQPLNIHFPTIEAYPIIGESNTALTRGWTVENTQSTHQTVVWLDRWYMLYDHWVILHTLSKQCTVGHVQYNSLTVGHTLPNYWTIGYTLSNFGKVHDTHFNYWTVGFIIEIKPHIKKPWCIFQ